MLRDKQHMTPQVDSWNIVLPGSWNPTIFRPSWIKGRLTETQDFGVELAFGEAVGPARFRFDGIHLRADPLRLVLGVDAPQDESLLRIEDIAIRALRHLAHTPIRGAGINFGFLETNPSPELVNLFQFTDTDRLADAGFVVRDSSLKRNLQFDDLRQLNLTLELKSDGTLNVGVNFHGEAGSCEEAIAHLEGHMVELKNRILALLERAYGLALTQED